MPDYAIITDSTANLPARLIKENNIIQIPFNYFFKGKECSCNELEAFDDKRYYTAIKNGATVTTSQINPQKYIDFMINELKCGKDILFIGLSSGISGSFNSALMAREQLKEEFPDRQIKLIDSLGAGLGEGLLALSAAKLRADGVGLAEAVEKILSARDRMYQVFIVDDLMHLKRTGRLSNAGAVVGTLLGIKPLLKGSNEGKIVAFGKTRGRQNSINALAEKYFSLARLPEKQIIGISYADCREDAEYLASLIQKKLPPKELLLLKHEPVTGSHLGPGTLALFFEGNTGVREQ